MPAIHIAFSAIPAMANAPGDEVTAMRLFHAAIGRGDPYAMDHAARIYQARGDTDHAARLRSQARDVRTVEPNRQPPVLGL